MAGLKLEVGKSYRNRNGGFEKIVQYAGGARYPFVSHSVASFTESGEYVIGKVSSYDLIEEVADEPAENKPKVDPVNHPTHYTNHPSGVECIQITEHFNFNRGNAIKYIWRAGEKGDAIEDLRKALFYVAREIDRIEKGRQCD